MKPLDNSECLCSSDVAHWRKHLLLWYGKHRRQLPWRDIADPYRIWLSEIILQQTRISQGQPYFERFVKQFPTVEALAAAPIDQVMNLWQGLGYYSRARNLHKGAQQIVALGHFPNSKAEWLKIAGVGEYTAAAIASFALGEQCSVVDGNVYRVLARHYGVSLPIDTSEGKTYFARLAQQLLDTEHPADYNQAIMDFGALQCVPKNPICNQCPFADSCVAHNMQQVDSYPAKSRSVKLQTRHLVLLYIKTPCGILLHKRTASDIWRGLYEPLTLEFSSSPSFAEVVAAAQLPKEAVLRQVVVGLKHELTHRHLKVDAYEVCLSVPYERQGFIVVPETERSQYAVSTLVARIYQLLNSTD